MQTTFPLEVLLGRLPGRCQKLIWSMLQARHERSKVLVHGLVLLTAMFPAVASAQWTQVGPDINGEVPGSRSGQPMAYSSDGSRLVIGAKFSDDNGTDSGQVRVYRWLNPGWVQVGGDLNGEGAFDYFGHSVAISSDGTQIAIGAPYQGPDDFGRVSVYSWHSPSSQWIQVDPDIVGEVRIDKAGYSVALSGNGSWVAVGAPGNDGNGNESGRVRVFRRIGSNWEQMGLSIDGEAGGDLSGFAVALSTDGDRLAIGAPENGGNGVASGQVRVYRWSGTSSNWHKVGADIDGEAAGDESGSSVSLSSDGSRVAIGAPGNDGSHFDSGHTRVHEWSGTSWVRMDPDIDGEAPGDEAGTSVALSSDGSRLAVGAPDNDGVGFEGSGHVRVYKYSPWPIDRWLQTGSDIDGEWLGDASGASVALSSTGFRVAIGAPLNHGVGGGAGHVRVYTRGVFSDGFESGNSGFWAETVP